MEDNGLNQTGFGQGYQTTSLSSTTLTMRSTSEIRILNLPLALILSGVMLAYLLLVLIAVCIHSIVLVHGAVVECCGLCADLAITCRQCCSCYCRCSHVYSCMQYAVDECRLFCRDCKYRCVECMQICHNTSQTTCSR